MKKRKLGKTNLMVSRLGLGTSEIGHTFNLNDTQKASSVLNQALDEGINFIDTAACYGTSEELIGKTIAGRREEYIISTKAGHAVNGSGQDWTAETITKSIERSLKRMNTDHLDIVHLHSCGVGILEAGEVVFALEEAKKAGKTRFIGYSGDNESAIWAVRSGLFDTLQTSYNVVDQFARKQLFDTARDQNMGIIAKRPIANAVWGKSTSPSFYAQEYFRRYQEMTKKGSLQSEPDDPITLVLGFALAHPAIDTAIVGTSNPQHLAKNIQDVEKQLPLDTHVIEEFYALFDRLGGQWPQEG